LRHNFKLAHPELTFPKHLSNRPCLDFLPTIAPLEDFVFSLKVTIDWRRLHHPFNIFIQCHRDHLLRNSWI